ncbi:hypothetical protein [Shinella zoogloeoides]|uniref:hypothetical protein n=1 Tax=Shinella zoogloeoides TaxID=352475 RepID=UPI001F593B8E|nr:hypothetical protein [Shinella zoogloeoides]
MYRPNEDDFLPGPSAHSDEPMRRPDYKAKKHGKPNHGNKWPGFPGPRANEEIGGGHFVFKRGRTTGRIKTGHIPFEHATYESAINEAARLSVEVGGKFEVLSRVGGAEVVR